MIQYESISGKGWRTWTPAWTLTGAAVGAYDSSGRYTIIGKTCFYEAKCAVNGSSNWTGLTSFNLTLPVTAKAVVYPYQKIGDVCFWDNSGGAIFQGWVSPPATGSSDFTSVRLFADRSDGTYGYWYTASASVPFGWAASDYLTVSGFYEIA